MDNLNEALDFLSRGKESGKVMSFSDYLNESEHCINETWEDEPLDYKEGDTVYLKNGMHEEVVERINVSKELSGIDPNLIKPDTEFKVINFFGNNAQVLPKGSSSPISLNARRFTKNSSGIKESAGAGYGDLPFYYAKNGDSSNYFFKLDNENKSFVLTVGKFSKVTQPTEIKSEYGVLAITELNPDALDQAVLDQGKFEPNNNPINDLTDSQIIKLFNQVAICVDDYVQKSPKVSKFYDEMQLTLKLHDYDNKFALSLDKWPGGNDAWKMQVMEKGKMNIIMK